MSDERASWLEWRRSGVGASDVPAILGISPWASAWSVWASKLGLLPDDQLDDDDPREFGRRAEAMVAPWFHDKTGLYVTGEQMWLTHKAEPWMLATPDALVCDDSAGFTQPAGAAPMEDVLGPLEIKATNDRPWSTIPEHYQAQGQWQMAVGGWDRMWFAVLHYRRLRIYELARNQADIDYMTERARTFWHDHVLAGEPPEVDGSDATAHVLAVLYPEADKGASVELGLEGAELLEALADAKADAKAAEARAKHAGNELRALLGDAYAGTIDGRQVVTLGTQTRKTTCAHCGAVDESAPFRVLRPKASKP